MKGRKSRPKAEIRGGVLGEGEASPLPTSWGDVCGSAMSSHRGVRGGASTT